MCFFNVTQNAPKIYDGGLALTENPLGSIEHASYTWLISRRHRNREWVSGGRGGKWKGREEGKGKWRVRKGYSAVVVRAMDAHITQFTVHKIPTTFQFFRPSTNCFQCRLVEVYFVNSCLTNFRNLLKRSDCKQSWCLSVLLGVTVNLILFSTIGTNNKILKLQRNIGYLKVQ